MTLTSWTVARDPDTNLWAIYYKGEMWDGEIFDTEQEARRALPTKKRHQKEIEAHRRIADRIDGYDRDDLGESPDF